jgi:uncharacterized protein YjbJ (UPF0337 family)
MSFKDKAENKVEDLKGRGKESAGKASGDHDLEAEGRADQTSAKVKDAGEKVKDATDKVGDAFKR